MLIMPCTNFVTYAKSRNHQRTVELIAAVLKHSV